MAERRVEIGETGEAVRASIKQVRQRRGMRLEDLSDKLRAIGHPLSKASLSQIETGGRRVDVDDLTAISVSLGVKPVELLPPEGRDRIPFTPGGTEAYEAFMKLPESERDSIMAELRRESGRRDG